MSAIYTVFTSPHHAPMPNHLPTLIVTPHGQPNQILYTFLHTEENRVNYLLTPSPQGDLCVAKLFPPERSNNSSSSLPSVSKQQVKSNVVRCEASRDLRWTIENTGVMSPIYKIINQDDTPLYQISKPNPNAEFWTMFYFKYAGHQIPPKRIEFGKVAKNPPEKGGGTRITITGRSSDEKEVWQTLGEGNEDCVEWVVCCACLNLLDDQILQAAEKKAAAAMPPASTSGGPASTRPNAPPIQRSNGGGAATPRSIGPGIASTAAAPPPRGPASASNLAQAYRTGPASSMRQQSGPPMQGPPPGAFRSNPDPRASPMRPPMNGHPQSRPPPNGNYDPRDPRYPANARSAPARGPPPPGAGRRF